MQKNGSATRECLVGNVLRAPKPSTCNRSSARNSSKVSHTCLTTSRANARTCRTTNALTQRQS
eukprot:360163-Amphidinium_carterae.1